eukprot:6680743-Prymnesium_polylepis.1
MSSSKTSAAAVASIASPFGTGLVAAQAFAAGDTVHTEEPLFLLVDGASPAEMGLREAVGVALGLPAEADMSALLAGALALWLTSSADERAAWLGIFHTPDRPGMA